MDKISLCNRYDNCETVIPTGLIELYKNTISYNDNTMVSMQDSNVIHLELSPQQLVDLTLAVPEVSADSAPT